MAKGDVSDMHRRLKRLLPPWFGHDQGETPRLDALMLGPATSLAFIYGVIAYVRSQTRIKTASAGWLDLISRDFFGAALPRLANQSDESFRARIISNILRPRGTRDAIRQALVDVTGKEPWIFEPMRPTDTGGYGLAMGYGVAGRYGSMLLPYQMFLVAYRPLGAGVPNVAGYTPQAGPNAGTGGYAQGALEYISAAMISQTVTDADIYAAVEATRPAGTIVWMRLE